MEGRYTALGGELASRELGEACLRSEQERAQPQGDSETMAAKEIAVEAIHKIYTSNQETGQENEGNPPQGDSEMATDGRNADAVHVYTHLHDLISETGRGSFDDTRTLSLVYWYRVSNALFVLGSLFYVGQGISYVIEAYNEDDNADDDYENDESLWYDYGAKTLGALGALAYVANAIVDLRVSILEIQGSIGSGRFGDDPSWEIGVGCTFGLAAICDFIGELIWDDDKPGPGYAAASAAVHIYLLNAVFTISGRMPRFSSFPKGMMSAGDLLFLVGSVIDVLISYVDNPNTPPSWYKFIAWAALFSSGLWFLDSILYVLANHLRVNVETDESVTVYENDVEFEFGSTISSHAESPFLCFESITNTERKLELL
jgi:hypothetical protein